MYTNPTVADFKAYFTRGFPYGTNPDTEVLDSDIQKAIDETALIINQALFCSQEAYTLAFLYLAAHTLVQNLQADGAGCAAQAQWLIQSHSVGGVSESFAIPEYILKNPMFANLSKTTYGNKYLMFIYPLLTGQVFTVKGGTLP